MAIEWPDARAADWKRAERFTIGEVARLVVSAELKDADHDGFVEQVHWLRAMHVIESDSELRVIDEVNGQILAATGIEKQSPNRYSMTHDVLVTFMRRHGFESVLVSPRFFIPVRVKDVPPALLALPSDAWVHHVDQSIVGAAGSGSTTAGNLREQLQATIERQSQGWFTLLEAAGLLESAKCGSGKTWVDKLKAAARDHVLPMHERGTLARVEYGHEHGYRRVAEFDEWVHVDDLNAWLDAHEPRLPFRFEPVPSTSPTPEPVLPTIAPKPMQRWPAQEQAILVAIRGLGHDPQRLPAYPIGKPCAIKAAVKDKAGYSVDVFEKAWKRLTGDQRVARAPGLNPGAKLALGPGLNGPGSSFDSCEPSKGFANDDTRPTTRSRRHPARDS